MHRNEERPFDSLLPICFVNFTKNISRKSVLKIIVKIRRSKVENDLEKQNTQIGFKKNSVDSLKINLNVFFVISVKRAQSGSIFAVN